MSQGCEKNSIFVNSNSEHLVTKNEGFKDVYDPKNVDEAVQIRPQRITVKLRPSRCMYIRYKYPKLQLYTRSIIFIISNFTVYLEVFEILHFNSYRAQIVVVFIYPLVTSVSLEIEKSCLHKNWFESKGLPFC